VRSKTSQASASSLGRKAAREIEQISGKDSDLHLRFINNAILLIGSMQGPRPKPDLLESQTLSR